MPIAWNGPLELPPIFEAHAHWFNQENGIPDGFELVYPGTLEVVVVDKDAGFNFNREDLAILTDQLVSSLSQELDTAGRLSFPIALSAQQLDHLQDVLSDPDKSTGLEARLQRTGMPVLRPSRGIGMLASPATDVRPGIERLIVVIDADIAFAHERFRLDPLNTRLAGFWDMDATLSSPNLPFGRLMYEAEINGYLQFLSQQTSSEADLYRKYIAESYLDPTTAFLPSVYGHGTHVLDMACGNNLTGDGHDQNIDQNTAIFAVQLPREAVAQTHGYFLSSYISMALQMAGEVSQRIENKENKAPEVLINISVGGHANRHDGYSDIERLMDEYLGPSGHMGQRFDGIFLPAGNSYDTRTHARISVQHFDKKGWTETCTWRIRPDDGTASFLEIWLPKEVPGAAHPLGLTITRPDGAIDTIAAADLGPGSYHELVDIQGGVATILARLYVNDDPGGGNVRRRYLLAVRHTQLNRVAQGGYDGGRADLAGDWKIKIELEDRPEFLPSDYITLWIARDDEILRFKSGARQSIFPEIDGALDRFPFDQDQAGNPIGRLDGVVDDGTVSDMATGVRTSVIAAHLESDGTPAEYSGEGIDDDRSVAGRNIHPTVSAIADQSKAHPGLIGAGYFSGSSWRQGGTSVSSPLALRHMLDYQRTPGAVLKGMLVGKALQADPIGPNNPDRPMPSRIGAGRIDATTEKLPNPVRRRASRS